MQRHVSWCVTVKKQIKVKITETEQREEQRRKQQGESKNFKLLLFFFFFNIILHLLAKHVLQLQNLKLKETIYRYYRLDPYYIDEKE